MKINETWEKEAEQLFTSTEIEMLVRIARGEIDCQALAKLELARRCCDDEGKFVGSEKARKIHEADYLTWKRRCKKVTIYPFYTRDNAYGLFAMDEKGRPWSVSAGRNGIEFGGMIDQLICASMHPHSTAWVTGDEVP